MNWHYEEVPYSLINPFAVTLFIIMVSLMLASVFIMVADNRYKGTLIKRSETAKNSGGVDVVLQQIREAKQRDAQKRTPLNIAGIVTSYASLAALLVLMFSIIVTPLAFRTDANGNDRYESLSQWMDETYGIEISRSGAIELYNTVYGFQKTTVAVSYKGERIAVKLIRSGNGESETFELAEVENQTPIVTPFNEK